MLLTNISLKNKLYKLQHSQELTNISEREFFQFHDPIQNLSNVNFDEELNQIAVNYKSNLPNFNTKTQIENLVVESEHIIKTSDLPNKEGIKYHIHKILENHIQKNLNKNTTQNKNIKPIINKIKSNNLTIILGYTFI
mgnify:CR=1 FL=1